MPHHTRVRKELDTIAIGKYEAGKVGCSERCEAHQLVSGLKKFDAGKPDTNNLFAK